MVFLPQDSALSGLLYFPFKAQSTGPAIGQCYWTPTFREMIKSPIRPYKAFLQGGKHPAMRALTGARSNISILRFWATKD